MKKTFKFFGIAFLIAAILFGFVACGDDSGDDNTGGGDNTGGDGVGGGGGGITLPTTGVIDLTFDKWADGNIASGNGEQWFKFTATASTHYIHFQAGSLIGVSVQLYDNTGKDVSFKSTFTGSTTSTSRTVTVGSVYYINVTPSNTTYSGLYRIGFTASNIAPTIITLPTSGEIDLTFNIWADCNFASDSLEQWFKFTTTDSNQYIHFLSGNLTSLYVQLYDNTGKAVYIQFPVLGRETSLIYRGSISSTVTTGSVYHIKVSPYNTTRGTYRIGFTASTTAPTKITLPTTGVIDLTADTWADGDIPLSGSQEQWFKFTATISGSQRIHFLPSALSDSLTSINMQLYDENGIAVDIPVTLDTSYYKNTTRSVTAGNEYYIRVKPALISNNGTYKIAFNVSTTAPTN
jgi:hypothetical protein